MFVKKELLNLNNIMGKTYQIFISSVGRLLEEERGILSNAIRNFSHKEVKMEQDFCTDNETLSIDVDKHNIDNSDAIIVILSHLHGEIIGDKIGDKKKCPLKNEKIKNCIGCNGNGCNLSYTEYEYHYAKLQKKIVFVLQDKHIDNEIIFNIKKEEYNKKITDPTKQIRPQDFYPDTYMNFIQEVDKNQVQFFINVELGTNKKKLSLLDRKDDFVGCSYVTLYKLLQKLDRPQNSEMFDILGKPIEYLNQIELLKYLKTLNNENLVGNEQSKIRILSIRGDSFVIDHYNWLSIFSSVPEIEKEIILSSITNDVLIKKRCPACKSTENELEEKTMRDYKMAMQSTQRKIKEHGWTLLLHNEETLPYRLVFIGEFLYFTPFFPERKESQCPVLRVHKNTLLYQNFELTYKKIKKNAKKAR